MSVKCFDIVNSVIKKAEENFGRLAKLNNEDVKILEQYCSIIDSIMENNDGSFYDVSIDEDNGHICIGIGIDSLIGEYNDVLYSLIERSLKVSVEFVKEDCMLVKFWFPSVFSF